MIVITILLLFYLIYKKPVHNSFFIYRKILLSLCFFFYKNINLAIINNISENIKTDKTLYKQFLDYKELLDFDTYCKYVVLETPLPSFLIDEFQTSLILLIYSGIFFYKSTEYLLYLLDIALDFEPGSDDDMLSESNKKNLLKIEKILKKN